MNSYSAIFIPKINNKLGQIIKGIKLLNLINNKINIQNGGSPWSDVINKFAGNTHYIYDTEEYEKLVTQLLNEIALLRAVVIELLSQLPEKEKDIIKSEVESVVQLSTKHTLPTPKIEPPKIVPPNELTNDDLFMNTLTQVYEDQYKDIKIYKFTKDTYLYIDSKKFTEGTLWSKDINNNRSDSKYKEENMEDIYILFVAKYNLKYLFSFKHNDLRNMQNKQLNLNTFYTKIREFVNVEVIMPLREWFTSEIKKYVNSSQIENATKSGRVTKPQTVSSTTYNADNCHRYNIIYRDGSSFDNYTILTINDTGTEYITDQKIFGSIPFYIDIYDFIKKFTNVIKIKIIGNFKIHFYNNKINASLIQNISFNKINTLTCKNVYLFNLHTIIKLFTNLTNIIINYTENESIVFKALYKESDELKLASLSSLLNYLNENKTLQIIQLPSFFKITNIGSYFPSDPVILKSEITRLEKNKQITYI
jgi:hypothetical protein